MALSTRHRAAIYQALAPTVGEEAIEAMLSEFPAAEHDELVTRQFLRAEVAELRTEMHSLARQLMIVVVTAMAVLTSIAYLVGQATS